MRNFILLSILILSATACGPGKDNGKPAMSDIEDKDISAIIVDTVSLHKGTFYREVVSTGKIRPAASADLRFRTQGIISSICVRNGQHVVKGDTIACLENTEAALELESAQNSLEKAELELRDIVVGFGYGNDTISVPKDLLAVAKVKSGYKEALFAYKKARINLENTVITAPFDGTVANLQAQANESAPEILCRIYDQTTMEVHFPLLESEADFMEKGAPLSVVPFVDSKRENSGNVSEINPLVDEKGQVLVKGRINPPYEGLIPGMSAKVYLRKEENGCYAVPKSAVVIRDGYDVVFLYNPGVGTASWLYVDIVASNSSQHVISGNRIKETSLPEKAWVIVSGNLNLADGAKVIVRNQK